MKDGQSSPSDDREVDVRTLCSTLGLLALSALCGCAATVRAPVEARQAKSSPQSGPADAGKPSARQQPMASVGAQPLGSCFGLRDVPLGEPEDLLAGRLRVKPPQGFYYQSSADRDATNTTHMQIWMLDIPDGVFRLLTRDSLQRTSPRLIAAAREQLDWPIGEVASAALQELPLTHAPKLGGVLLIASEPPEGMAPDHLERLLGRAVVETPEGALVEVTALVNGAEHGDSSGCDEFTRRLFGTLEFGGRLLETGPQKLRTTKPFVYKPAGFVVQEYTLSSGRKSFMMKEFVEYGDNAGSIRVAFVDLGPPPVYEDSETVKGRVLGRDVRWRLWEEPGEWGTVYRAQTDTPLKGQGDILIDVGTREPGWLDELRAIAEDTVRWGPR